MIKWAETYEKLRLPQSISFQITGCAELFQLLDLAVTKSRLTALRFPARGNFIDQSKRKSAQHEGKMD